MCVFFFFFFFFFFFGGGGGYLFIKQTLGFSTGIHFLPGFTANHCTIQVHTDDSG